MFANTIRKNLVSIASAYGEAKGLSLSQVSKRCYGNAVFLEDFRRGRQSVSLDKIESMLVWFRENWPKDADWPMVLTIYMNRTAAEK